jgi:hypothetical protein
MKFFRRLLGKPSQDDFAEMMIASLRARGVIDSVSYVAEDFRLDLTVRGKSSRLWLGNAFQEYLSLPRKERDGVFERFSRTVDNINFEIPSRFEDAKGSLLPRVRDRAFYGLMKLRSQANDADTPFAPPTLPLADHLAVGLTYDLPDSILEITDGGKLAEWGVTFEDALEAARDNLWTISRGKFEELAPGLYVSPWRDNHDASRLFLHDLLWHLDVGGDHVAAVPNRDTLIVTGSENIDGLGLLAQICAAVKDAGRPVSSIPVILNVDERRWRTFRPPDDHPHAQLFKNLRIREELDLYGEQKPLLEAIHEQTGRDLFVASYSALSRKNSDDLFTSYCVWTEGVASLLPKADTIAFVRADRDIPGRFRWETAMEVLGHRLRSIDLAPPRFLTDGFPTDAEFAAMEPGRVAEG